MAYDVPPPEQCPEPGYYYHRQKIPMGKARQAVLELAGREVVITNPDKPFFPQAGQHQASPGEVYAAVAEGALRGIAGRPIVLKRYVDGAAGEPFFQKRAPEQRPEWIETVELRFPSGRRAREIVVRDAAQLLWMVNLGCIDLNPHPVHADDLEHPDGHCQLNGVEVSFRAPLG